MRRLSAAIVILLAWGLWPGWAEAACTDPEFCQDAGVPSGGGGGSCWSAELGHDTCNVPPAPCPPGTTGGVVEFVDNLDGDSDGELAVLGTREPTVSCGTLRASVTGYYRLFDRELSESCDKQLDETGYITVENSCNADGWAVEANVGSRYLVLDADNTPACSADGDCEPDRVCRDSDNAGRCCVKPTPTFLGTFLLVAGEDNKICLHHFCPEWQKAKAAGKDLGFVTGGCKGINSIHLRLDAKALACEDARSLRPCTFGCDQGQCLPDPCEAQGCPGFCKDGVCLDQDPCAGLGCAAGCINGRCLPPTVGADAGAGPLGAQAMVKVATGDGCACALDSPPVAPWPLLLLLLVPWIRRRRRRL